MRSLLALRIAMALLGLATASPAWATAEPNPSCRQAIAQHPAIVAGRHHQPTPVEIAQKEAACGVLHPARQEPRPLSAIG